MLILWLMYTTDNSQTRYMLINEQRHLSQYLKPVAYEIYTARYADVCHSMIKVVYNNNTNFSEVRQITIKCSVFNDVFSGSIIGNGLTVSPAITRDFRRQASRRAQVASIG